MGNTKANFVFKAGMTFDEYVQAVHVAYLQPIINTLTPLGTTYEIGTTINPFTVNANVTKKSNDIVSIGLYLNSTKLIENTNIQNGGTVSATNVNVGTNDTNFSIFCKVNDGKTITSKENKFYFVRYGFYGHDTNTVVCSTSNDVRALNNHIASPKVGSNFKVQAVKGDQRITIAIPNNLSITSAKYVEGMNAESKDILNMTTINVEGAGGYKAITYKLYTYIPAIPFPSTYTLDITLG